MTLKEFIENNEIDGFEKVGTILMNVVSNGSPYGLDVDTSSLIAGTKLEVYNEWILVDDILTINGLHFNTTEINLL
jgi:hypothetical protein